MIPWLSAINNKIQKKQPGNIQAGKMNLINVEKYF